MEDDTCKGLLGKIFGHKFEGRYSIEEKKPPLNVQVSKERLRLIKL